MNRISPFPSQNSYPLWSVNIRFYFTSYAFKAVVHFWKNEIQSLGTKSILRQTWGGRTSKTAWTFSGYWWYEATEMPVKVNKMTRVHVEHKNPLWDDFVGLAIFCLFFRSLDFFLFSLFQFEDFEVVEPPFVPFWAFLAGGAAAFFWRDLLTSPDILSVNGAKFSL